MNSRFPASGCEKNYNGTSPPSLDVPTTLATTSPVDGTVGVITGLLGGTENMVDITIVEARKLRRASSLISLRSNHALEFSPPPLSLPPPPEHVPHLDPTSRFSFRVSRGGRVSTNGSRDFQIDPP